MEHQSEETVPVWMENQAAPDAPLRTDLRVEVCVIGAGIAGLSTAYLLAREGRSVAVLEAAPRVISGETRRTTAHLSTALDDRYYEIEQTLGLDRSRLAAESHAAAIGFIETTLAREGIDCDFLRLDGYLFAPPGDSGETIERELAAARRAGVGVERVARAPIEMYDTGPCLRFRSQGQFDPLKYLAKLRLCLQRDGGVIYADTRVRQVDGGAPARVETTRGYVVKAGSVVVATNSPIHDNLTIHAKQGAYRTYVIGAEVPAGAVQTALYWDTLDPYHYVRLKSGLAPAEDRPASDILIVGGEDHKQGDADDGDDRFRWLEAWTRERFPIRGVAYHWSGLVLEPADLMAFIGADGYQRNVYLATGDSGHGITHGTIAGMLLTDLIQGRENRWAGLYDPSRTTAQALSAYVSGNIDVVSHLAEWLTPGDVKNHDNLAPGSGAVVRCGLSKVAVYRDPDGVLHESSAICTHLGCIVHWNSTENSWDCPCHGSRYDPFGTLLRGPAVRSLESDPDA